MRCQDAINISELREIARGVRQIKLGALLPVLSG